MHRQQHGPRFPFVRDGSGDIVRPDAFRFLLGGRRLHAQLASRASSREAGDRNRAASSRCSGSTANDPARSAIVRATRRTRSVPLPESDSRSARATARAIAAGARRQAARRRPAGQPSVESARSAVPAPPARRRSAAATAADASGSRPAMSASGATRRHGHPQVDPVAEGAADPAGVALRRPDRAGAAARWIAGEPARARVHRRDQQEPGRKPRRAADPGDRHEPVLERLAQRLEHVPTELRQLVEEENPVIGAGDLAGRHPGSAADHRRVGQRVMGRPDRRPPAQREDRPFAGHRRDDRRREGFGVVERRQQAADGPRDQRLPGPGRPDEDQSVTAGEGDLERPSCLELTTDVGKVRRRLRRRIRLDGHNRLARVASPDRGLRQLDPGRDEPVRSPDASPDRVGRFAQRPDADDLDAVGQGRFAERIGRHDDPPDAAPREGRDHGQDPWDGRHVPAERQLADHRDPARRGDDLLGAEEDSHRDCEIDGRAGLAQVRRGKVHGDPARRMAEAGVANGAADALARLLQGGVREPDDREARQARRHVDLDPDDAAVEADESGREQGGQHPPRLASAAHRPMTAGCTAPYQRVSGRDCPPGRSLAAGRDISPADAARPWSGQETHAAGRRAHGCRRGR